MFVASPVPITILLFRSKIMPRLVYEPHPANASILIPMGCEVFRDVAGWEPLYKVSNWGRIRSLPRTVINRLGGSQHFPGKILKPTPDGDGYFQVILCHNAQRENRKIHRLVLEAFIGPCPEGQECRHLDGNKTNNRIENLAWGTPQDNADDRIRHGTAVGGGACGERNGMVTHPEAVPRLLGERNGRAKLTESQVREAKKLREAGWTYVRLGQRYTVHSVTISNAIREIKWKHLSGTRPITL